MLEEGSDHVLRLVNLFFILVLLILELFNEVVDFFLLLVEDLVLLGVATLGVGRAALVTIAAEVVFDLLDVPLVGVDHLPHLGQLLLLLLDLRVVLLDAVHKPLSCFGER